MRLRKNDRARLTAGNRDLFRDEHGRMSPGYLTTAELISELDAEHEGTARHTSLAIEAIHRAATGAFPRRRIPDRIWTEHATDIPHGQ
jgi:hypothetical protein